MAAAAVCVCGGDEADREWANERITMTKYTRILKLFYSIHQEDPIPRARGELYARTATKPKF